MTKSKNKKLYCPGCQGVPVAPYEDGGVRCLYHSGAGVLLTKEKHMERLKQLENDEQD